MKKSLTKTAAKISSKTPREPEEIEVNEVIVDHRLQPRSQQNFQTVIRYRETLEDGGSFPPITVARIDGLLLLVDGFHRLQAHRGAGKRTIEAVILEGLTREDAFFEAVIANTQHGIGLSKDEKRAAFGRYIKAKRHILKGTGRVKSLRMIQADFRGGLSRGAIHKYLGLDFPAVLERMNRQASGGPMVTRRNSESDQADAPADADEAGHRVASLFDVKLREAEVVANALPKLTDEAQSVARERLGFGIGRLMVTLADLGVKAETDPEKLAEDF